MPEQQQPKQPMFKIVTGALKAVETSDGRKTLHCTASSTINDRHGDEITEDCIRDMSKQAVSKAMTIFLNHEYKWPEDAIGKTIASQILNRANADDGTQIWDMDLDIELANSNERGLKSWRLIKEDGLNAGISIGAMIEDWEYIDKDAGFWGGLRIKKVDLLEASIVGIPANQRSWVQNAVKAIKSFTSTAKTVETEETSMPTALTLSEDVESPAITPTPDAAAETVEDGDLVVADAVSPETPESTETPEDLPAIEAAVDGAPETDAEGDESSEVSDDDIVLALTLQIADLKAKITALMSDIETLRKENSDLTDYVKDADAVLTTVAKTPLGRKTSIAKTVDSFHSRMAELYGDEIVKYLEI